MEIVWVAVGISVPEQCDYIEIRRRQRDHYEWTGVIHGDPVTCNLSVGSKADAIVEHDGPFASEDAARASALYWAKANGSVTLYVLAMPQEGCSTRILQL